MSNDLIPVSHPKTAADASAEERYILRQADIAMHSDTLPAQQWALSKIGAELNYMSPVERMYMARVLRRDGLSPDEQNSPRPETGLKSIPRPEIVFDRNGDIKSLTFKSLADDVTYGQEITVNLADKRKDEDWGAQVLPLPNGSREVVHHDFFGGIESIQDPSGLWIERNADGKTWTRNDGRGASNEISDLTVDSDGSMHYKLSSFGPQPQASNGYTESVSRNGDRNFRRDVTRPDGTIYPEQITTHLEYPNTDVSEIAKKTITDLSTGKSDFEQTTKYADGMTMQEWPTSRQTVSADGNTITIQNTDSSGRPLPGTITEHIVKDKWGSTLSGTLDVTLPDGTVKHIDTLKRSEWRDLQNISRPKIKWLNAVVDPRGFVLEEGQ